MCHKITLSMPLYVKETTDIQKLVCSNALNCILWGYPEHNAPRGQSCQMPLDMSQAHIYDFGFVSFIIMVGDIGSYCFQHSIDFDSKEKPFFINDAHLYPSHDLKRTFLSLNEHELVHLWLWSKVRIFTSIKWLLR